VNTPVEITSEGWKNQYQKDVEEWKKTIAQLEPQQGSKPAEQGAQGTPAANKPAEKR